MPDVIFFEYWDENEAAASIRLEWLENEHKAHQQRLRESHDAEQEALKEEWDRL